MNNDFKTLFTNADYLEFKNAVKGLIEYNKIFSAKDYKFKVSVRKCDNGLWNNNFMCSFGIDMKTNGFGYPFQTNELIDYFGIVNYCQEYLSHYIQNEIIEKFGQISMFDFI